MNSELVDRGEEEKRKRIEFDKLQWRNKGSG